ncbi:hypothetical protein EV651_112283 [Kribbella sp. VKM Ac-2571]|nr:hypothetical protein EV651_112283 [Kribbella sp. VKM Ac-2571]
MIPPRTVCSRGRRGACPEPMPPGYVTARAYAGHARQHQRRKKRHSRRARSLDSIAHLRVHGHVVTSVVPGPMAARRRQLASAVSSPHGSNGAGALVVGDAVRSSPQVSFVTGRATFVGKPGVSSSPHGSCGIGAGGFVGGTGMSSSPHGYCGPASAVPASGAGASSPHGFCGPAGAVPSSGAGASSPHGSCGTGGGLVGGVGVRWSPHGSWRLGVGWWVMWAWGGRYLPGGIGVGSAQVGRVTWTMPSRMRMCQWPAWRSW